MCLELTLIAHVAFITIRRCTFYYVSFMLLKFVRSAKLISMPCSKNYRALYRRRLHRPQEVYSPGHEYKFFYAKEESDMSTKDIQRLS